MGKSLLFQYPILRTVRREYEGNDVQSNPVTFHVVIIIFFLYPPSHHGVVVEVMDYFRAILRKKEYSERALALTEEVIQVNPANYTGWLFRRECLMMLKSDLKKELEFISKVAKHSSKNYQLWHHRRVIVNEIGECGEELDATAKALLGDPKNYHVWAHRQWVLQKFSLFKGEIKYVESLLRVDIRNNSAWNQRFFVVKNTSGFNKEIQNREVKFTFEALEKAPNNISPWNYLRGLMAQNGFDVDAVKRLAAAILKKDPKCAECLSFLIDIALRYPTIPSLRTAAKICNDLKTNLCQIREKYWEYQEQKVRSKLQALQASN
mmetsp:Transcript_25201/g.35197  ORF Transcript_25201/g.35197 Transcript_25201/m.35197 type:complete len:321 (-) Transcript_25201:135-1097(-)